LKIVVESTTPVQWPSCCCYDAVENKLLLFRGSDHGPQLYFQSRGRFDMLAAMVFCTLEESVVVYNISGLGASRLSWREECQLYGPPATDRGPWAMTTLGLLICPDSRVSIRGDKRTRNGHRRNYSEPPVLLFIFLIPLSVPRLPLVVLRILALLLCSYPVLCFLPRILFGLCWIVPTVA
jgi:hypothetical protein